MKRVVLFFLASAFAWNAAPAHAAIQTYFGEDLHNNPSTQLAAFPNAANAETNFLSNLVGVGTETFETQSGGAPLNLSFPGAGTATLTGGNGAVVSLANGVTNGAGRYGITRDGGQSERFWEVQAGGSGNFVVTFSQAIAAFGFYGIDIGDFGGQLRLQTAGGSSVLLTVPNTVGGGGSTDGSVLFFGFIATTLAETVTSVSFLTSTGGGDVFAFDDFTVGSIEQVQPPGVVPEPMTFLVWGLLFGIGGACGLRRESRE